MATAVGDEQPQALPTATLAYKRVRFMNRMDDTSGLNGANDPTSLYLLDMMTFRPTLESGWYYLGQAAIGNTARIIGPIIEPTGVIVHALEDDALKDVTSWERVWTDEGSGSSKDYALWRGVPPSSDYIVLGGILSTNANYAAPDSAQTFGIKAIRRDLLIPDATTIVWDAEGSGARNDGSVWHTDGTTGIGTAAMIPMSTRNQPPKDMGLSLDPTKVLEITSSSAAEGDATTSESADT